MSHAAKDQRAPVTGRYIGQDPKSPLVTSTINDWLMKCKQSHPMCNHTLSKNTLIDPEDVELPTRCIDTSTKHLILCETGGTKGKYVTLSHRWEVGANGATQLSKTTSDNYNARLAGKGFDMLPQTFIDAVETTRKLNIKYIWIDSICIVQDRAAEWATESLKMAQYYQNAILNIAITDTASKKGFLLACPDQPFLKLVRLPYGLQAGYFYISKPVWHINTRFQVAVQNSDLMRRGWVFQEWLLCRRILYFTPNHIFFECHSGQPRSEGQDFVSLFKADLGRFKRGYQLDGTAPCWYRIVRYYSRLDLTKVSDRIVALAGVAQEMRESFEAVDVRENKYRRLEYVCGLWLRDIHRGLLWESWRPLLTTEEPSYKEVQNASTWSWISIMTGVFWWDDRKEKVQDAFTITKICPHLPTEGTLIFAKGDIAQRNRDEPADPAFDVNNFQSSLYLSAKLIHVVIDAPLDESDIRTAVSASGEASRIHGTKDWKERLKWRGVSSQSTPETLSGWALMERRVDFGDEPVFALLVSTKRAPDGLSYGYLSFTHPVYCVLFVVLDAGVKYRRVGVGRLFGKEMTRRIDGALEREVELI